MPDLQQEITQAVAEIKTARDQIVDDADTLHAIAHGPATGPTSLVTTESGEVKTAARAIDEFGVPAANAAAAAASAALAEAAAEASGSVSFYDTKAEADAGLAGHSEGDVVEVMVDESRSDRRTRYRKESGVYVFKLYLDSDIDFGQVLYVEPGGNDTTGNGSPGAPYATLGKALSVAADGTTIRCGPSLTVLEEIDVGALGLSNISILGDKGNPILVNCFDEFEGEWALADGATNTYEATIAHVWGGDEEKLHADRGLPCLLQGTRRLKEIRAGTPEGDYVYTDEAAALAYVEATPGTFYVGGLNGSSYTAGWEAGNQTYYVHPLESDDANSQAWFVCQRRAPFFGTGNRVANVRILGGWHRDGWSGVDCLIENAQTFYPAGHGCIVPGCTLIDPVMEGGNQSVAGVNAFHGFSDTFHERVYLLRPRIRNYDGPSANCFNCHGVVTDVAVCGLFEVDGVVAENVTNVLGGMAEVRDGVVLRRPKVRNARYLCGGSKCGILIQEPDIETVSNGNLDRMMDNVGVGHTLELVGGALTCDTELLRAVGGGTMRFKEVDIICGLDNTNFRWITATGAPEGILFERCTLAYGYGDRLASATPQSVSGTTPLEFTDCALSNIALPTHAVLTRTVFCDPRVRRSIGGGSVVSVLDHSARPELGHLGIGAASTQGASSTSGLRNALLLTNRAVYEVNNNGLVRKRWDVPSGFTPRGVAYVGDNTDRYFVVFGDGGKLYKAVAPYSFAEVTTSRSTNWIGYVTKETDGEVLLLGDAGEITRYDPSSDTFTDETSGVAFPLRHGIWDGSNFYICGGDGTSTGAVLSSADGITWTSRYSSTNAQYLTCLAKVSGIWMAFMSRGGPMLTSTDGTTWSANDTGTGTKVKGCITDGVRNRVLFWGTFAAEAPTRAYIFSGVSGTTVTAWARAEIDVPGTGIVAGCFFRYALSVNFYAMFLLLAPLARAFLSQDGQKWTAAAPIETAPARSRVPVTNPAIAQMLAQG